MPPQLLFDIAGLDLTRDVFDQEAIRQCNPHRGDMEMLNGIVHVDNEHHRLIGYKNVRNDEFWVSGHIPGRPLLPGVLMVETAAQLASFYARKFIGWSGFVGFGGVEDCRFRQQVVPPARMYVLGEQISRRHGHLLCAMQGIVNGILVFETKIIGVEM
ncbi:MAG: beta-hydroxyacyl-ACP dehydratase [Tepidisphaeraceae bacterium]|jgi:3-hydroxyacyl-[acyl-carrier-protein] dehydratase